MSSGPSAHERRKSRRFRPQDFQHCIRGTTRSGQHGVPCQILGALGRSILEKPPPAAALDDLSSDGKFTGPKPWRAISKPPKGRVNRQPTCAKATRGSRQPAVRCPPRQKGLPSQPNARTGCHPGPPGRGASGENRVLGREGCRCVGHSIRPRRAVQGRAHREVQSFCPTVSPGQFPFAGLF